jgi:hypothetical protein
MTPFSSTSLLFSERAWVGSLPIFQHQKLFENVHLIRFQIMTTFWGCGRGDILDFEDGVAARLCDDVSASRMLFIIFDRCDIIY